MRSHHLTLGGLVAVTSSYTWGSRGLSGTPPQDLLEFGVIRNIHAPGIIDVRAAQLRLILRAQAVMHFCVAVVRMTTFTKRKFIGVR